MFGGYGGGQQGDQIQPLTGGQPGQPQQGWGQVPPWLQQFINMQQGGQGGPGGQSGGTGSLLITKRNRLITKCDRLLGILPGLMRIMGQ